MYASKYGLEDNTVDFIGHALALHIDDSYLDEPAIHTVKRIKVKKKAEFLLQISILLRSKYSLVSDILKACYQNLVHLLVTLENKFVVYQMLEC